MSSRPEVEPAPRGTLSSHAAGQEPTGGNMNVAAPTEDPTPALVPTLPLPSRSESCSDHSN
jgi:hypothetical protein